MPLSSRRNIRQYVHRKLLFRLRRLAIIFLIISGVVVYEVLHNYLAAYLAAAGFILGIAVGLIVAKRMHTITWDIETNKAITRMDRIGILILVFYLIFSIARHWIFSFWLQGSALSHSP